MVSHDKQRPERAAAAAPERIVPKARKSGGGRTRDLHPPISRCPLCQWPFWQVATDYARNQSDRVCIRVIGASESWAARRDVDFIDVERPGGRLCLLRMQRPLSRRGDCVVLSQIVLASGHRAIAEVQVAVGRASTEDCFGGVARTGGHGAERAGGEGAWVEAREQYRPGARAEE